MDKLIDDLIKLAFAEDIGDGDHTTLCCIPETAMGKSQLIIKEDGVLAGVEMAKKVFARLGRRRVHRRAQQRRSGTENDGLYTRRSRSEKRGYSVRGGR